mmetsp:Transcript_55502/g.141108  ORF Transcript_55502/g.141108 Transcript_55502/m.141108 type:complete len:145 (+) Transcript_55502:1584-2018(+)
MGGSGGGSGGSAGARARGLRGRSQATRVARRSGGKQVRAQLLHGNAAIHATASLAWLAHVERVRRSRQMRCRLPRWGACMVPNFQRAFDTAGIARFKFFAVDLVFDYSSVEHGRWAPACEFMPDNNTFLPLRDASRQGSVGSVA